MVSETAAPVASATQAYERWLGKRLPSAWGWAVGGPKHRALSLRLLKRAVGQRDPFYVVKWVVRRLGPRCGRIELSQFPKHRDEREILEAMGAETANLHLATAGARPDVLRDVGKRQPEWLHDAAQGMAAATQQDWKIFRSATEGA